MVSRRMGGGEGYSGSDGATKGVQRPGQRVDGEFYPVSAAHNPARASAACMTLGDGI